MSNSDRAGQTKNNSNRPQNHKGGTGQQTGGMRGEKINKEDREGFRSSEQKHQKGNRGGNR